jgi:hypothetical protein
MARNATTTAFLALALALMGTEAAASPPGTTCQVFPANNVWNTDVSRLPGMSQSLLNLTTE